MGKINHKSYHYKNLKQHTYAQEQIVDEVIKSE